MFNRKLSIFVPSTFGESSSADMSLVKATKQTVHTVLCVRFGGSTELQSFGNWVNDSGDVVSEAIAICFAAIDESVSDEFLHETAILLADYVKGALQQTCVLWTIEAIQGDLQ